MYVMKQLSVTKGDMMIRKIVTTLTLTTTLFLGSLLAEGQFITQHKRKVWQMASVPQGIVVDTSKITSQLEKDSTAWTVKNGQWVQSPKEANAQDGLWLKPKGTEIDWTEASTANKSFDYKDKAEQLKNYKCSTKANEWRLAGVQFEMNRTDLTASNITPDDGCNFTFVYAYDVENFSWNTQDVIPAQSAIWIQHICYAEAECIE